MPGPRHRPGAAAGLAGRRHEPRLLGLAVTLRRPVLLLGPPGVSKTTMLRELAGPAAPDRDAVHWVTGDEVPGPAVRAVLDELSVPVRAPELARRKT